MRIVVVRVEVAAPLLAWARRRSGLPDEDLARRFPKLAQWENGQASPTLKQLESFARATHTPVGYLFLPEVPDIPLPLPDFRTRREETVRQPSADLLETIFEVEQRQEWYRDYAQASGEGPLDFVSSLSTQLTSVAAAALMRERLRFGVHQRGATWSESLRLLAEHAEDLGVLVMISGIVGSNTHRVLDPDEFLGFALADVHAPAVFVNGSSSKAAQIFTLAHELAHIWLGQSGLDDSSPGDESAAKNADIERWCSEVAAEMLVPLAAVAQDYQQAKELTIELERLAKAYKVSTLVVLRRLRDAGYIGRETFWSLYETELNRVQELAADAPSGSGGNFYNTQPVRTSKRFARAVITSTLEGQTLYSEAFRLLGFKKVSTLNELAHHLGVA